jgi:alanyl-tRNA synthetase
MPTRPALTFTHNAPVTDAEIREIEKRVNAEILANAATQARVMAIDDAQKTGAVMLFGEKYGETVRVLDIGSSRELCGGTHVQRTGDIGLFKIVSESGVAAGVRRVEAITGANALAYLQQLESTVAQAAGTLKAPAAELQGRIGPGDGPGARAGEGSGRAQGQAGFFAQGDELVSQAVDVKGIKVLAARVWARRRQTQRPARHHGQAERQAQVAAIVLAAVDGAKVQIAAGATADVMGKVKAGELVNFVAQQVGGKGGGKPDMAMAGGTDASQAGRRAASRCRPGWPSGHGHCSAWLRRPVCHLGCAQGPAQCAPPCRRRNVGGPRLCRAFPRQPLAAW